MKKIIVGLTSAVCILFAGCAPGASSQASSGPVARQTVFTTSFSPQEAAINIVQGTHGVCDISNDFLTVRYTLTDLNYTGTDMCSFTTNNCSGDVFIDLSQASPSLNPTGFSCN